MKSDIRKKCIVIIICTIAVAALYAYMYCFDTSLNKSDIKRPDENSSEKTLPVNVSWAGGADFDMDIEIEPRRYTEDEIEDVFDEAVKILDATVLGDNDSFDHVTEQLQLVDEADGYPFSVQWIFDDYDTVNYDGSINNIGFETDQSVEVTVRCVIKYEGWIREKEYTFKVCAPDMSDPDIRNKWLAAKINEAAAENPNDEYISLPDSLDGEDIGYSRPADVGSVAVILMLGAAAVIVVVYGEKKRVQDEEKKRVKELKRDYSEMIHKLALLMGAGMTVRKAWEHIVNEYKTRLASGSGRQRYVYEEMTYTYNRLCSGVSEINAYGEFGTRCGTKEYLKFASLLVQNLQKGSRELVNLLELEAIDAFEERKNMAKKLGEEAGTKLLFPMVMMLVVVMGIIMFPALTSFSV